MWTAIHITVKGGIIDSSDTIFDYRSVSIVKEILNLYVVIIQLSLIFQLLSEKIYISIISIAMGSVINQPIYKFKYQNPVEDRLIV